MKVELLHSSEELRRELEAAENSVIVAQQIGYLSGISLLSDLLNAGVTEDRVRWMLGQLRENQEIAREVASKRPNCLLLAEE